MPFDSTPVRTTTKARELAALLRDRSRWPEGFEWDYTSCETCAMGLARDLCVVAWNCHNAMAKALAMSNGTAYRIFLKASEEFPAKNLCGHIYIWEVTPEHIATLLDRWADEEEVM